MKVEVDRDACEAQCVCMRTCPEVFRVDEEDALHILLNDIPEQYEESVRQAVKRCPKQALSLSDE